MSYHITRLTHDAPPGAVVGLYCGQCRRTTFLWSPYAARPKEDGCYVFNMCADNPLHDWPTPKAIWSHDNGWLYDGLKKIESL